MLAINLFNGLVYGALLIVMCSGLALIYGLRRVVNFAHGSLYMLGAYLGYSIAVERARMDDPEYARWATVSFKDMQWTKWMDIARYGQRSIAISELANLVTQNPAHPSMERWMTDLMKLKDEIIQPKAVAP